MKQVSLKKIPKEFHQIVLQNNKVATLYDCVLTRVPDINPKEDIIVFKYDVPCPLCDTPNKAYSYDAIHFGNTQLTCNSCGIYYRPVILRETT